MAWKNGALSNFGILEWGDNFRFISFFDFYKILKV
jgi:hypothetical protein